MNIFSKFSQKTEQRLLSSAALYGLSDVAVLAVGGFLLLPVYTHSLSQAEFGQYVAVRANLDIGTYLLQLGLPSAVARLYFDRKREGRENAYLSGIVILFFIFATAIALLAIAFGPWFWNALSPAVPVYPALPLTLAIAIAGALSSLTIVWLRSEYRVATVVSLQVGAAAILAGLSIFLLTQLQMGVAGIFLALLVSALLPATALVFLFGRRFKFGLNKADIIETLHYAVPIFVGYIAYFLLNRFGLLLLQRHASVEELAVFGLAQQLSMIVALACSSFGSALQPAVFGAAQDDMPNLMRYAARQLTLIMLVVCVGLLLFGKELIDLIAPDQYAGSVRLLIILVVANFTITFSLLSDTVLLYYRRPKTSVAISVASALVACAIGLLLVPLWHAEGAAISVAGGLVFRMLTSQWIAWRISGQSQIALGGPAFLLIGVTAVLAVLFRDTTTSPTIIIAIKLAICAVAILILYLIQRWFSPTHA